MQGEKLGCEFRNFQMGINFQQFIPIFLEISGNLLKNFFILFSHFIFYL